VSLWRPTIAAWAPWGTSSTPPRSSTDRRLKPHPVRELTATNVLQPGWYTLVHTGQSDTARSSKTA
jgi:hypothetical protein